VAMIRDLAGATDPTKADPQSLRGRFGRKHPDGGIENVVHASERPDEAETEIRRFFGIRQSWWTRLRRLFSPRSVAGRADLGTRRP